MEEKVQQTLFARSKGPNVRIDFVAYGGDEEETSVHYGQFASILKSEFGGDHDAYELLLREMRICEAADGNRRVVEMYGFPILAYKMRLETKDHAFKSVPLSHVFHRAVVVPDIHSFAKLHGVSQRLCEALESFNGKVSARFFVISTNESSFGGFHLIIVHLLLIARLKLNILKFSS